MLDHPPQLDGCGRDWAEINDHNWVGQLGQATTAMGTLQNLAKVGFTAGEMLCLHFPAVSSQLDSLNQPGVHYGKLI
jgi:hypothetical protein